MLDDEDILILGLSGRAINLLRRSEINTIKDLISNGLVGMRFEKRNKLTTVEIKDALRWYLLSKIK